MTEKTNITTIIPNSTIGNTQGVIVGLSSLFINNNNTAIQETKNGKHLIRIFGSLVGDKQINYLADRLNLKDSIINTQYHNADINITFWINGTITSKRKDYLTRNFVKGACIHNVMLEVTGYDAKYQQLVGRMLSHGNFDLPGAKEKVGSDASSQTNLSTAADDVSNADNHLPDQAQFAPDIQDDVAETVNTPHTTNNAFQSVGNQSSRQSPMPSQVDTAKTAPDTAIKTSPKTEIEQAETEDRPHHIKSLQEFLL